MCCKRDGGSGVCRGILLVSVDPAAAALAASVRSLVPRMHRDGHTGAVTEPRTGWPLNASTC